VTVERGLLVGGERIRGTGWIMRDPSAWWKPRERGTRPRAKVVDRIVGHWTAGHPHTSDAGPRVVRAMKARKRADGSPMDVGIGFVIGWDGLIWQTADLLTATVHVGVGPVNAASIGVEICNPGTRKQALRLGHKLPHHETKIGPQRVDIVTLPRDVLDTWTALCELLCSLSYSRDDVRIPRVTQPPGRLSRPAAIRASGVLEHLHFPGTKIDAGGQLTGALREAGWG
jgi:hypothetical protein